MRKQHRSDVPNKRPSKATAAYVSHKAARQEQETALVSPRVAGQGAHFGAAI
jgi:hypothetical protein